MDRFYEQQTGVMCHLNDNEVEETPELNGILEILDIEYSFTLGEWIIIES